MKSNLHHHKLENYKNRNWLCDNCGKKDIYNLTKTHQRYHCNQFDFNLCLKCVRKSSKIMKQKPRNKVDLNNIIYTPRNKKTIDYLGWDVDDN